MQVRYAPVCTLSGIILTLMGLDLHGLRPTDAAAALIGVGGCLIIAAVLPVSLPRGTAEAAWYVCAALFLAAALFAPRENGARSWIHLGGLSFQPSELAKPALALCACDKRQVHGMKMPVFTLAGLLCAAFCAALGDLGSAAVFAAGWISGLYAGTGRLRGPCLAAGMGAAAVPAMLRVSPTAGARLRLWGKALRDPYGAGRQQALAISACAGGGFFGCGGEVWLRDVYAAESDLAFCLLWQKRGLFGAFLGAALLIISCAQASRRGACAVCAGTMLLTMGALNALGSLDILPFTGVTYPFLSRGGSALVGCFLLACIADFGPEGAYAPL